MACRKANFRHLAPTDQVFLSWPKWQFYQTSGAVGEAPDIPAAQRLMELLDNWNNAPDANKRAEAWQESANHADNVFAIGLVAGHSRCGLQPSAQHPKTAIWAWSPRTFRVHRMDEFYFEDDS